MVRIIASVVFQSLVLFLLTNPLLGGLSPQNVGDNNPGGDSEAHGAHVSRMAPAIDPTLLPPPDEFFLDMFIDRYPADGGYRVKRFYGHEFFDAARERAIERKRQTLETTWNRQFHARGRPATPLSKIEMPIKGVPRKVGGFRSRLVNGFPSHKAYDIIAAEGTPVHPIGHGIVVAAEGTWWKKVNKGESIRITDRSWWDTAELEERPISLKSGNFVVIYHPSAASKGHGYYSFYAHLADGVPVSPGQIVGPSDIIGRVEHSGYNAMRQGHGGHLHISVLKDLGQGYLEPIKVAKYWGVAEERPTRRRSKAKLSTSQRKARRHARGRS